MGENRRDFRVPVRIGASVAFEWGGTAPAIVSDLSRSGLSFTVLRRDVPLRFPLGGLSPSTTVLLKFEVDGAAISAVGRIAWVRMTAAPGRPDRVSAGVAIAALERGQRQTLLAWLETAFHAFSEVARAALAGRMDDAAAGLVRLGWTRPDPGTALSALRYAARYATGERVS